MTIHLPRTADYFLTVPAYEVAALQRYLDLMERNLDALIEQDPQPDWDGRPETRGQAFVAQLHHDVVSTMLPQIFRSSFVLVLYAVLEAAITETALVLSKQHGCAEFKPGQKFLKEASGYLMSEFGIVLLPDETRDAIHLLKRVRDAFVHANGRKGAIKERTWTQLERDRQSGAHFSLEDGYVKLDRQFLINMLLAVRITLRQLILAARQSLEDAAKGPNAAARPRLNLGGIGNSHGTRAT